MVVGSRADQLKEAIDQKSRKLTSPPALHCHKLVSSGLYRIFNMIGSICAALREVTEQKKIIYPHLLIAFTDLAPYSVVKLLAVLLRSALTMSQYAV